jgi:hypothetical protein
MRGPGVTRSLFALILALCVAGIAFALVIGALGQ